MTESEWFEIIGKPPETEPVVRSEKSALLKPAPAKDKTHPGGGFCGARTRSGTPCKRRDVYKNGRCKLHGGLSSGPKSPEGKRRSSLNALKRSP